MWKSGPFLPGTQAQSLLGQIPAHPRPPSGSPHRQPHSLLFHELTFIHRQTKGQGWTFAHWGPPGSGSSKEVTVSSVCNGRQPGRGSPQVCISLANILCLLFQLVLPSEACWDKQFLASVGVPGGGGGQWEGGAVQPPPP